jgi:hypothetical protein
MTGSEGLRLFTAEEATRTLPLVSRIATDIAHENDRLQRLLPELRRARSRARNADTPDDLESIREQVARSSARLEAYLDELRDIGCMLHEPTGVIDFRSMLDGRPVSLCWRIGDERVGHWHEPGRPHLERRQLRVSVVATSGTCSDAGG